MEEGVRRWLVNISQWDPSLEQFSFLVSILPSHERPAITRFVKTEDKKRALVSRLLQYALVHEVLGIPFDEITINRTVEGKPYLKRDTDSLKFPNFNFNVSHSGDYVGIESDPLCLVGLDIVSSGTTGHEMALGFIRNFTSYFTTLEWKAIVSASTPYEVLAEFYRYWCLKEAYVKALGAGLGYGMDRLEFRHDGWTNISVIIDGVESREWRFLLFELDNRHWVSVARGHPRGAVDSYRRTLRQLDIPEEEYYFRLSLPPAASFTLCSVEQLIPISYRNSYNLVCNRSLSNINEVRNLSSTD